MRTQVSTHPKRGAQDHDLLFGSRTTMVCFSSTAQAPGVPAQPWCLSHSFPGLNGSVGRGRLMSCCAKMSCFDISERRSHGIPVLPFCFYSACFKFSVLIWDKQMSKHRFWISIASCLWVALTMLWFAPLYHPGSTDRVRFVLQRDRQHLSWFPTAPGRAFATPAGKLPAFYSFIEGKCSADFLPAGVWQHTPT